MLTTGFREARQGVQRDDLCPWFRSLRPPPGQRVDPEVSQEQKDPACPPGSWPLPGRSLQAAGPYEETIIFDCVLQSRCSQMGLCLLSLGLVDVAIHTCHHTVASYERTPQIQETPLSPDLGINPGEHEGFHLCSSGSAFTAKTILLFSVGSFRLQHHQAARLASGCLTSFSDGHQAESLCAWNVCLLETRLKVDCQSGCAELMG